MENDFYASFSCKLEEAPDVLEEFNAKIQGKDKEGRYIVTNVQYLGEGRVKVYCMLVEG